MTLRIGASGLLFAAFILSGCVENKPTPDASVEEPVDASVPEDRTVFIELRYTSAGPNGDGGFIQIKTPTAYSAIKLFVGGDAGHVIDGVSDGGRIVFEDVPTASNVIELRYPHSQVPGATYVARYETKRRDIYFAYKQWGRTDVEYSDAGTDLQLSFSGLTAWDPDFDSFYAYSAQAQFARGWVPDYDAPNFPDLGDTSVNGMEVNTAAMTANDYEGRAPLVDSRRGDTLTLVQHRTVYFEDRYPQALDRWDPWAETYPQHSIASAEVATPLFSSTTPVQLNATFAPLVPTPITIDVRADSFAAAAGDLAMPANARMSSRNLIYFEPGDADLLYLSPTPPIWEHYSRSSTRIPVEPGCYPNFDNECDAGCAQCNSALTMNYRAPGNMQLPVELTHPFTDPGTEMLATDWRIWSTVNLGDGGTVTLSAWNNNTRPAPTSGTVIAERVLSAPRELTVDGFALPPVDIIPLETNTVTPTLAWKAPTLGTPNYYRVQVLQYLHRGGAQFTTPVVSLELTTKNSVTIPDGVLRPGNLYAFRVTAVEDAGDPDDLRATSSRRTLRTAEAITGLIRVVP